MAKSEIILPTGDKVSGNWSTEETLAAVLSVLEKTYGKKGKGGGAADQAAADSAKTTKYASKTLQDLAEKMAEMKEKIRDRIKNEKELIETTPRLAEALNVTSDAANLAGRGIKNLSGTFVDTAREIDQLDGSVKNASDAFFKMTVGAGIVGAVFGALAGVIDQFAEFQIGAIQTGFSFSQMLVTTRDKIADIGLNMGQFGQILSANGEAIRSLGGNSAQSAHAFVNLVGEVKASARQFGLFGLTTEEITSITAERLNLLRIQGINENDSYRATVESFALLNHEVLAYAKLTGSERREIMRNNLATREGSELLLADLSQLGPNATTSFDSIMQSMTAVFGKGGDNFASLFQATVESHFMDGMERMTGDQLGALSQVTGLRELFEQAKNDFIAGADDPTKMRAIGLDFARNASTLIKQQQADLVKLSRYQEDNPVGEYLRTIVAGGMAATNFMRNSNAEQEAAFTDVMAESEQQLMMLRERIQVIQNTFMASLLQGLGVGKLENLMDDATFNRINEYLKSFGDFLSSFRENIIAVADFFGGGPTGLIAIMTAGAIALFAAKSLFTSAMVNGAAALWELIAANSIPSPGGAGSLGGLGLLIKRLAIPVAVAIGAAEGIMDPEMKAAKLDIIDRAALGVLGAATETLDLLSNAGSYINGLAGVGPGWDNGVDISGDFRNTMIDWLTGSNAPATPITQMTSSNAFTGVGLPSLAMGDASNHASFGTNVGDVNVGMNESNAWRFTNSDNALLSRMALALEESVRVNRKLLEAVGNQ